MWDVSMGTVDCCRSTAKAAYGAVEIPEGVIDLLTGLRDYLQDKCEPPVYVSDRRFMKSIQMLQVAAYADGRDSVSAAGMIVEQPGTGAAQRGHVFAGRMAGPRFLTHGNGVYSACTGSMRGAM